MTRLRAMAALLTVVVGLPLLFLGFERIVSDAATRLAYRIRNEALLMQAAGDTVRSFEYSPDAWPDGVAGAYRIEIGKAGSLPQEGHGSIGVARNLTERPWYWTSYHLNYVTVPEDLMVAHQAGEATVVTLEARGGRIALTGLK